MNPPRDEPRADDAKSVETVVDMGYRIYGCGAKRQESGVPHF